MGSGTGVREYGGTWMVHTTVHSGVTGLENRKTARPAPDFPHRFPNFPSVLKVWPSTSPSIDPKNYALRHKSEGATSVFHFCTHQTLHIIYTYTYLKYYTTNVHNYLHPLP